MTETMNMNRRRFLAGAGALGLGANRFVRRTCRKGWEVDGL